MKFDITIVGLISLFVGLGDAAATWPAAIDELEDVMFLQTGHNSRGLRTHVTPCGYSEFGAGRQTAAEWLRMAFHDMATANVYMEPRGGVDASIAFELDNGENIGTGFATSLQMFAAFKNKHLSVADMIALGAYAGVRACGGPIIPMRGGRTDATEANSKGVPSPGDGGPVFTGRFFRMGFDATSMIQMVACGHAIGGVHSVNFPDIVKPGTAPNGYALFDTTLEFDNQIVTRYLAGPLETVDPLVIGAARGKRADLAVFLVDQNATVQAMAQEAAFNTVCSNILQRMIEVVPTAVTLSDVIAPYEVKPSGVQLTLSDNGNQLQFTGEIRVRTTSRSVTGVQIVYQNRNGGAGGTITGTAAGTANGFDDSFAFYSFSATLPVVDSISSFTVVVSGGGGSTTFDNNGAGFPVQDSVIFQAPNSCFSGGTMTVVAAVRNGGAAPTLDVTQKSTRTDGIILPDLTDSTVAMTLVHSVGPYTLYSASAQIASASATTFDVISGSFTDGFKKASALGATCAPISPGTSSSSTTVVSSSSSLSQSTTTTTTPVITTSISTSQSSSLSSTSSNSPTSTSHTTSTSVNPSSSTTSSSQTTTVVSSTTTTPIASSSSSQTSTGQSSSSTISSSQTTTIVSSTTTTPIASSSNSQTSTGQSSSSTTSSSQTTTIVSSTTTTPIASSSNSQTSTVSSSHTTISPSTQSSTMQTSTTTSSSQTTSRQSSSSTTTSTTSNQPSTTIGSSSTSNSPIFTSQSSTTSHVTTNPPQTTTTSTTQSSSQSTTSSTTSAAATPSHLAAVGDYQFQGCWTETQNVRALSGARYTDPQMTISLCASKCSSFTYFSVEYGEECYCGNTLNSGSTQAPLGDCNFICPGNSLQFCGAGNRMELYKGPNVAPPQPTVIVPSSGSFNYYGCWTEPSSGGRALAAAYYPSNVLTVPQCVAACKDYKYAGTEYSEECYCANSFTTGSVLAPDGDCSMTCAGNKNTYCGGPNRLTVYINNGTEYNSDGCWTDSQQARTLTDAHYVASDMSVEKCQKLCDGYAAFGVEYGTECWCGNTVASTSSKAPLSDCSFSCPGDSTEKCGAGDRMNLYRRAGTPFVPPNNKPTIGGYKYSSCRTDLSGGNRALSSGSYVNATGMTNEYCSQRCSGFKYFGTEYGQECYCGDAFDSGSAVAADSDCNFKCPGDGTEFCGAGNRLTVYERA